MKLLDYSYLPDAPKYKHQVIQRWKLLGFLLSERTFVSEYGRCWYMLPTMHMVTFSDDFEGLARADAFATGRPF